DPVRELRPRLGSDSPRVYATLRAHAGWDAIGMSRPCPSLRRRGILQRLPLGKYHAEGVFHWDLFLVFSLPQAPSPSHPHRLPGVRERRGLGQGGGSGRSCGVRGPCSWLAELEHPRFYSGLERAGIIARKATTFWYFRGDGKGKGHDAPVLRGGVTLARSLVA